MKDPACVPYWEECKGCGLNGHASFWKTVVESDQWKAWVQRQETKVVDFDVYESQDLGLLSPEHWQAFLYFIVNEYSKNETRIEDTKA